jgi:hypothetical protein
MLRSNNRIVKGSYSLALAVPVAALYLYVTLTAWDRFIFDAALYDANLRNVRQWVQAVLLFTGAMLFGIIAANIAPTQRILQLLVCGGAVFWWLYPYGFLEGTFLPILPFSGTMVSVGGAYLGRNIVRHLKEREQDRHGEERLRAS